MTPTINKHGQLFRGELYRWLRWTMHHLPITDARVETFKKFASMPAFARPSRETFARCLYLVSRKARNSSESICRLVDALQSAIPDGSFSAPLAIVAMSRGEDRVLQRELAATIDADGHVPSYLPVVLFARCVFINADLWRPFREVNYYRIHRDLRTPFRERAECISVSRIANDRCERVLTDWLKRPPKVDGECVYIWPFFFEWACLLLHADPARPVTPFDRHHFYDPDVWRYWQHAVPHVWQVVRLKIPGKMNLNTYIGRTMLFRFLVEMELAGLVVFPASVQHLIWTYIMPEHLWNFIALALLKIDRSIGRIRAPLTE